MFGQGDTYAGCKCDGVESQLGSRQIKRRLVASQASANQLLGFHCPRTTPINLGDNILRIRKLDYSIIDA